MNVSAAGGRPNKSFEQLSEKERTELINSNFVNAARLGNAILLQPLLDKGADINAVNKKGKTALHYVAKKYANKKEYAEALTILLSHKAIAVEKKSQSGKAALHFAAKKGNIECLKALKQLKPDINFNTPISARNIKGKVNVSHTPLHLAVIGCHTHVVDYLLSNKADVNAMSNDSTTPFHLAAERGDTAIAQKLLDYDANCRAKTLSKAEPIHFAVASRQFDIIKMLIEKDERCLNARNGFGQTALHLAVTGDDTGLVLSLLTLKPDVNTKDHKQMSPLQNALHRKNLTIVQALLDAGAETSFLDSTQQSFHHLLAQIPGAAPLIKSCAAKGIKFDVQDVHGATPLHLAAVVGAIDNVKALIEVHSNVNHQDKRGCPPYFYAIKYGKAMVNEFLKAGADPNFCIQGRTPIHVAAETGRLDVIKMLHEEFGVPLFDKASANDCLNPLHIACVHLYKDIVKYLVSQGAPVNDMTPSGKTALHLVFDASVGAEDNTIDNILGMLLDAKADPSINFQNVSIIVRALASKRKERLDLVLAKAKEHHLPLDIDDFLLSVHHKRYDIAKRMLEAGVDVNVRFHGNQTLLHMVAGENDVDAINFLLQYPEVDEEAKNKYGRTPLILTVIKKCKQAFQIFIQRKVDLNASTDLGNTALHIAVETGLVDFAKILVKEGADVNARNCLGETPLHKLASLDLPETRELASLFKGLGAEKILNDKGETPVAIAENRYNIPFLEALGCQIPAVNPRKEKELKRRQQKEAARQAKEDRICSEIREQELQAKKARLERHKANQERKKSQKMPQAKKPSFVPLPPLEDVFKPVKIKEFVEKSEHVSQKVVELKKEQILTEKEKEKEKEKEPTTDARKLPVSYKKEILNQAAEKNQTIEVRNKEQILLEFAGMFLNEALEFNDQYNAHREDKSAESAYILKKLNYSAKYCILKSLEALRIPNVGAYREKTEECIIDQTADEIRNCIKHKPKAFMEGKIFTFIDLAKKAGLGKKIKNLMNSIKSKKIAAEYTLKMSSMLVEESQTNATDVKGLVENIFKELEFVNQLADELKNQTNFPRVELYSLKMSLSNLSVLLKDLHVLFSHDSLDKNPLHWVINKGDLVGHFNSDNLLHFKEDLPIKELRYFLKKQKAIQSSLNLIREVIYK